ncbi:metal ABC transporter substrate-binding protein [Akkermansiaceae bacterium]|nr:metal ABC transporter substrate-binding protein [bacterium]MDB4294511.1 metal ABC transporter substrate-binding protein [Akkermansiaceae bacterium]MDB4615618.1 metal ABC transporter substrate-binding protein [Akkermansiaceae bacterium]MDB4644100.1 metal ABC transporter substrate-binding protein [bacterium]
MKKLFLLLLFSGVAQALDVASLHPLITDAIRQVGGERVNVVEIGKPGMSVHEFQPKAADLKKMAKAKLIFASGKKLELYLGDLEDSLAPDQVIVEVGREIPSQKVSAKDQIYACCPVHSHGGIDPHWWHNVRHMERAVRIIERKLAQADPVGKSYYSARSKAATAKLRALDTWVKQQTASIPKGQRHLVTAHAAFGYFCKAYGFKATFVQGLSAQGEVPAKQLAESIKQIRDSGIPTVFPEQASNPKMLKQIAKASGAQIGKPLIADGAVASYDKMMRSNVTRLVAGLRK